MNIETLDELIFFFWETYGDERWREVLSVREMG